MTVSNAHLIAASPNLLTACEYILDNIRVAYEQKFISAPKHFHVQIGCSVQLLEDAINETNGG